MTILRHLINPLYAGWRNIRPITLLILTLATLAMLLWPLTHLKVQGLVISHQGVVVQAFQGILRTCCLTGKSTIMNSV